MNHTAEAREDIIAWLHTQIRSDAGRAGMDQMTTAALRRFKAELAAEVAEMDREGRLETIWKREAFPI